MLSTQCSNCGSYAINDDPKGLLCDCCWRDDKISQLEAERVDLRAQIVHGAAERLKLESHLHILSHGIDIEFVEDLITWFDSMSAEQRQVILRIADALARKQETK